MKFNVDFLLSDILQFDNSYSWVNSKTVHYEVELLEPDEDMLGTGLTQTAHNGLEHVTEIMEETHL